MLREINALHYFVYESSAYQDPTFTLSITAFLAQAINFAVSFFYLMHEKLSICLLALFLEYVPKDPGIEHFVMEE